MSGAPSTYGIMYSTSSSSRSMPWHKYTSLGASSSGLYPVKFFWMKSLTTDGEFLSSPSSCVPYSIMSSQYLSSLRCMYSSGDFFVGAGSGGLVTTLCTTCLDALRRSSLVHHLFPRSDNSLTAPCIEAGICLTATPAPIHTPLHTAFVIRNDMTIL